MENESKIIIANPIYDTVFKRMMENQRIARFFIGRLINEDIQSLNMIPQEYTLYKSVPPATSDTLTIIRFDYVAIIKTGDGHKKVLIEIQKAQRSTDLIRFRTYLGEQYKRMDVVDRDGVVTEAALPIISIYLLNFELEGIHSMAVHVNRTYYNGITDEPIEARHPFIESLTHDSHLVQVPRIRGKLQTPLEKMLSVFEQERAYFLDHTGSFKEYRHPVTEEMRELIDLLRHVAAEPEQRKELEDEWWSQKLLENIEKEQRELFKKELDEKNRLIEETQKSLEEKDRTIKEKDREIEALKRLLNK
jgi:hypothetical protein